MHLGDAVFVLRRSMEWTRPFSPPRLSVSTHNIADLEVADASPGGGYYPAVPESPPTPTSPRIANLQLRRGSVESVDSDDAESALDLASFSSLALSNRILNDPALAADPKAQLRISALTVQQVGSTTPIGLGGPINATSTSMSSHFGDGLSSLSRKSAPQVRPCPRGHCILAAPGRRSTHARADVRAPLVATPDQQDMLKLLQQYNAA